MQEGIQLPELLKKVKALREVGLRAKHVAFSFMKRRVKPLMARDTLGCSRTSSSRLRTSKPHIMPSSADRPSPSSWRYPNSPTWRVDCRCFGPATYQGEYSR
jgi:hypothetical protein